jgi:hypothetical protein
MTAETNSGVAYSMVCWKLCRAVGQVRPRLAQYIQVRDWTWPRPSRAACSMSSPRYASIQPAAGSQSGPPALLTRPRRSATSISSAGLRLDWLQFSGTQAPHAMPPIPPLIVAAGMRSSWTRRPEDELATVGEVVVPEQIRQPLLNAGGSPCAAVSRRDQVVDDVRPAGTACELDQPARDHTFLGVLRVRIEVRRDAAGEQIGGRQPRVAATGEPAAQQVGGGPQTGEARRGPREAGHRERVQISVGVEPGPGHCGVVEAGALRHPDPPGVVAVALANKAFPGPSGLTPITGETLPTKASHVAYRAKPSASGWIASPKT